MREWDVQKNNNLGAGVGGLTVAHELISKNSEYEIHIYERNALIGV